MAHTSLIDDPWFREIRKPSRYLGNEPNILRKPEGSVDLRIGLAFPDVYEVGMSHQGLKILYHLLNERPWLAAERVFCPWVDMESALRSHKRPLETLETGKPLGELDMIGFSLQHELCYTNVLTMLDLAGVPLLSTERNDSHPLVVAGGPACFNPEPISGVFDAVLIGDGEKGALEICRVLRRRVRSGIPSRRKDILLELSDIPGVYIPSFFSPRYRSDGGIQCIDQLVPGYGPVRKALIPNLEASPFPAEQVVPYAEPVHDRLSVEIARGCTRGCRFCQAGMIYRPVRERPLGAVLRHVDEGLRRTGYEEVSLLSLSSGDYSGIGSLIHRLMDRQSGNKVAVSLPSLRIDSLDRAWFEEIKRVRKTGFTLAPEAGSDRLRRIINKNLTNSGILRTAEAVYAAGWNLVKLYFMIGLPGETPEDLEELIRLCRKVARLSGSGGRRPRLHVSVATFVPKSHTPFMWDPQLS
ncbi:MAG: TIGR03960 family B12-binding radical SAM protein, partial [Desulfobacteraceae bacterium]